MIEVLQNDASSALTRVVVARLIHAESDAVDEDDEHGDALEPRRRDHLEAYETRLCVLLEIPECHRNIAREDHLTSMVVSLLFVLFFLIIVLVVIIVNTVFIIFVVIIITLHAITRSVLVFVLVFVV